MSNPEISVCLPVYNGAKTLGRLLDSISSQTFENFQVIMVDNMSADNSANIYKKYADRDQRFKYFRNHRNMGTDFSFQRGLFLSQACPYMVYVGHDDYWHPEYLDACYKALEADPGAVLAYSYANLLNEDGDIAEIYKDEWKIHSPDPAERYIEIISKMDLCICHYGLARSAAWADSHYTFKLSSAAGDNLLLASMALDGKFIQIERPLLYRNPPQYSHETAAERSARLLKMSVGNQAADRPILGPASLPFIMFVHAHLKVIKYHNATLSYPLQNRLCLETINILMSRYQELIKAEINTLVNLICQGEIHRNQTTSNSQNPDLPKHGQYPGLDFTNMISALTLLDLTCGLADKLKIPRINYARAILLVMLGRPEEALASAEAELRFNATDREALDLQTKLKHAGVGKNAD